MAPAESHQAYRHLLLSRERKAFAPQDDEALRHSSSSQNQRLQHRKKMSFFMLEVCEDLDLDNSTAFAAVAFFDRICKEQRVVTSKIEVVALCCVLVAAKFELDDDEPTFEDLNSCASKKYSDGKLAKTEQFVCNSLGFELNVVTPASFLHCYQEAGSKLFGNADTKTERRCQGFLQYFAKLYTLEFTSTTYRPSVAAAAILHVSRCAGSNGAIQDWPEEIRDLTGVSEYTFADLSAMLWTRYIKHCPNAASYAYKPHMLKQATSKTSLSQKPSVLKRRPLESKFSNRKQAAPETQKPLPSITKLDGKAERAALRAVESRWVPAAVATIGAAIVPPSLLISAAIVLASHSSPPMLSQAHNPQPLHSTVHGALDATIHGALDTATSPEHYAYLGGGGEQQQQSMAKALTLIEGVGSHSHQQTILQPHHHCDSARSADGLLLATYLELHDPRQQCTCETRGAAGGDNNNNNYNDYNSEYNNDHNNNNSSSSSNTYSNQHHSNQHHRLGHPGNENTHASNYHKHASNYHKHAPSHDTVWPEYDPTKPTQYHTRVEPSACLQCSMRVLEGAQQCFDCCKLQHGKEFDGQLQREMELRGGEAGLLHDAVVAAPQHKKPQHKKAEGGLHFYSSRTQHQHPPTKALAAAAA
jgi:hypothetical protein